MGVGVGVILKSDLVLIYKSSVIEDEPEEREMQHNPNKVISIDVVVPVNGWTEYTDKAEEG